MRRYKFNPTAVNYLSVYYGMPNLDVLLIGGSSIAECGKWCSSVLVKNVEKVITI